MKERCGRRTDLGTSLDVRVDLVVVRCREGAELLEGVQSDADQERN